MLTQFGKLEITVLVYFTIGLPIAIYVCKKHGFGRQAGWVSLVALAIVRIVGAAINLAAEQSSPPNISLYVTGVVFNSLGLIPMLFALQGLIARL
jgi:hypothetical protein